MKRLDAKTKKIIAATSVTIFSLLALTLGTFAWFASSLVAQTTNDEFQVVTVGGCKIDSVNLYKFIYPDSTVIQGYDYLKPENGRVDKYAFNEEEGYFGYYDDDVWVSVEEMNLYDPIEMLISRNMSLRDMNSNAIYEVNLSYTANTEVDLDLDVLLDTSKTKTDDQIYLSDCVDFDVFYPNDLRDNNPLFYDETTGQYNKYYPSYKKTLTTDNEKDYHKISYLSSLEAGHTHFYGKTPKDESLDLDSRKITFDDEGKAKLYINANYAPNQLSQYSKDIYLTNIYAVYDFGFLFAVKEANE